MNAEVWHTLGAAAKIKGKSRGVEINQLQPNREMYHMQAIYFVFRKIIFNSPLLYSRI